MQLSGVCPVRPFVCPCVHQSLLATARHCHGFAAVGPAARRYRLIAALPAGRRTAAANAGTATLSANVRSWRQTFLMCCFLCVLPSVLWHCWLVVRKSIWPVKKFSDDVLVWLSLWSEVQIVCIWSSWCHCHPKTPASFKSRLVITFLVSAYQGCPGKEAVKRV